MPSVHFEKPEEHIAVLTLNRPEAHNAIDDEMTHLMEFFVDETEKDKRIRAVILTGAGGKAFCAGADLKLIAEGRGQLLHSQQNGFGGFVYAKRTKPWIAAVNGFALAGGMEFCLACDLLLATPKSKFGLPEVSRGLIAGAGGLFRLPQLIPTNIALEMICTANMLSAERAYALGLVNALVEEHELMEKAMQLARNIAEHSPHAVSKSLQFVHGRMGKSEATLIDESNRLFDEILLSADALEGTKAFAEKRKPNWN